MPSSQAGVPGTIGSTVMQSRYINTAGYTLNDVDLVGQTLLRLDHGANQNLTINSGMLNKQPLTVFNEGAGLWTFTAGAGVTLISKDSKLRLTEQYSVATLVPVPGTADTYWVWGELA